jgi:hypothetical protein
MKTPSRSDTQYREIENFKDYELTQCIAYEMAKRNPEIKLLLAKKAKLNEQIFSHFNEEYMDKLDKAGSEEELKTLMQEFLQEHPLELQLFLEEKALDDEIVQKSFFPIVSDEEIAIDTKNPVLKQYYSANSQRAQARRSQVIDNETIEDEFNDTGTVKTVSGSTIKYVDLFPPFSRPLPVIPSQTSKEIDVILNLALPASDLTALVEEIKKAYEKSGGEAYQVQSPLTLAVEIDKELFNIHIKTKKKGSSTNLEMPTKRKQEVYADLLFLYDVYHNSDLKGKGEKLYHFRSEMIDYYAYKVMKYHGLKDIDDVSADIGTPRDQSIREYLKIMEAYIDDYGYKKLIA